MRVKEISVKKLFGVFNHSIPLNMEERITIIHGPNGFGKTIMLRMLDGFFNSRYAVWRMTPFEEFRVDFENGSYVRILPFKNGSDPIIDVYFAESGSDEKMKQTGILLSPVPDDVARDDAPTDLDAELDAELEVENEEYERGLNQLTTARRARQRREVEPEWLCTLKKSVNIHFVSIDRLLKRKLLKNRGDLARPLSNELNLERTVNRYTKGLTEIIQAALAEYGEVSQALDRTFPARVIKETPAPNFSIQELQQKLRSLEEKRAYLMTAGLLDNVNPTDGQVPQEIDDRTKSVLSVYVSDTEKKLSVLDYLAAKIDFFKRIVNQRFPYKKMSVGKERGLVFTTLDDQPLSTARLSSGEQHELVLFYESLFTVKHDSLILIDEPEISLHIAWQEQFLKDMQKIIQLTPMDFLIATHSPDIISDRWDLTVELKGPAQ